MFPLFLLYVSRLLLAIELFLRQNFGIFSGAKESRMMGSDVKSDSGKSRQRKARCFPQGDVSRPMSGGQFEQQRRVPVKNKTLDGGGNGQSSLLQPPTVPPFEFNSETRCFLDTPVFIGGRDEVRGHRELSSARPAA